MSGVACTSPPPPGWETALESEIVDRADHFPGALGIASGRVPLAPGVELVAGDEVLYGIRLETGGESRTWYLRVLVVAVQTKRWLDFRAVHEFEARVQPDARRRRELAAAQEAAARRDDADLRDLDAFASDLPIARIRVEAFDAAGELLDAAESEAVEWRLRQGLFPACVAGHRLRAVMRGRVALGRDAAMIELPGLAYDDLTVVGEGVASCEQFFGILQENPVTRRILYEVIALPSLWSMLRNFGVRTSFAADFFAAQRMDPARFPAVARELWSVPMTIDLNDQPALLARIVAGPGGAPDGAAAGVYAIVGRHPSDPDRRVFAQLLATRRGEGGRAPLRDTR